MIAAPDIPDPLDVEKERAQRFFVTRPSGYVVGAAIVLPLGLLWSEPRMIWLAVGMALMAATSLLGRNGDRTRWMAIWLSLDAAWTGVVLAVLGVHPLAATLLFAGHIVTGYLTLPRTWSRALVGFVIVIVGGLVIMDLPAAPALSPFRVLVTEAVMAAFGLAAIVVDLEMIVTAIRGAAHQGHLDLELAHQTAEQRAAALRSVSHELRTPLTSIGGFAHFLSEPDLDEVDRLEFAHRITNESAHLTHLVDDLLAAARLDAGQLVLEIRPVPVLSAAQEVVEVFRPRGLDVEIDIDPTHVASADSARLGQIIRNLLSNAEKYGGAAARVTTLQRDGHIFLSVCDRGPGVSETERERIFQDFAQSGAASHLTGTGLGLGISRRLANAMGGDLRYADGDTGACFELVLPAYA